MDVLIVGSGYSGLNVWHNLRSVNKRIIDQNPRFKFYSNIDFVIREGGKNLKFR